MTDIPDSPGSPGSSGNLEPSNEQALTFDDLRSPQQIQQQFEKLADAVVSAIWESGLSEETMKQEMESRLEKIGSLLDKAIAAQKKMHEEQVVEEKERLSRSQCACDLWRGRIREAKERLPGLVEQLRQLADSLPEPPQILQGDENNDSIGGGITCEDVVRFLNGRRDTIRLIVDMFERLLNINIHTPESDAASEASVTLLNEDPLPVSEEVYSPVLVQSEMSEPREPQEVVKAAFEQAKKALEAVVETFNQRRIHNGRVAHVVHDEAYRLQGWMLDFIRYQLLSPADGLERAIQDEPRLLPNMERYPEYASLIGAWINGYRKAQEIVDIFLCNISVKKIKVEIGDKFDPNTHFPIGIEERLDMEEGTITYVGRSAYEYNRQIVRPADVIVARLPRSTSS